MSHFVFVFLATTPWFETYRENLLQSMPASDHEFLNHYLACILSKAYKSGHCSWIVNKLWSEYFSKFQFQLCDFFYRCLKFVHEFLQMFHSKSLINDVCPLKCLNSFKLMFKATQHVYSYLHRNVVTLNGQMHVT